MNADPALVSVTVVYLTPQRQFVIAVQVPDGSRLIDAVRASGVLQRAPELDPSVLDLGVFNRARGANEPVREGDRIEVYRPLAVDPKEARRVRAAVRRRRRNPAGG